MASPPNGVRGEQVANSREVCARSASGHLSLKTTPAGIAEYRGRQNQEGTGTAVILTGPIAAASTIVPRLPFQFGESARRADQPEHCLSASFSSAVPISARVGQGA